MYLPKYLAYNTSNIIFGREWISKRREEIRPWTSFVKTSNFEVPASLPKVTKRFYKNIEYFQSNYVSFKIIIYQNSSYLKHFLNQNYQNILIMYIQVFVFLILFIYCLITSPMLLIVMALSGGTCYYLSRRNVSKLSF